MLRNRVTMNLISPRLNPGVEWMRIEAESVRQEGSAVKHGTLGENRGGISSGFVLQYAPYAKNDFSGRSGNGDGIEISGRGGRQTIAGGLWPVRRAEGARAAKLAKPSRRSSDD